MTEAATSRQLSRSSIGRPAFGCSFPRSITLMPLSMICANSSERGPAFGRAPFLRMTEKARNDYQSGSAEV